MKLQETKRIWLPSKDKCLTIHLNNDTISLTPCTVDDMTQQWNFAYTNETAYLSFDEIFGYKDVFSL